MNPLGSIASYKRDYRGYEIRVKRDFGSQFHLIDGMPCMWGYVVVKDGCNAMPGATWFQTVKEAKRAIDVLIEHPEGGDAFWKALRGENGATDLIQLERDIDKMRDVYMLSSQRESYDRIVAAALKKPEPDIGATMEKIKLRDEVNNANHRVSHAINVLLDAKVALEDGNTDEALRIITEATE